nr:hypothetical protein CFP56_26832 [Quercus suber]
MWRKTLAAATSLALRQPCLSIACRRHSSTNTTVSSAVNSMLLRSLKDHYLEVSKMVPPPKVSPPASFTILVGALDGNGPVLKRTFNDNEEINISVMRLANIIPAGNGNDNDDDDDSINRLFLHVNVSKPGQQDSLHFLCGFTLGQFFEDLDESMRDALHSYIDERGVNESLFPFLQAWLYVKDHRNLMRWFKSVGIFINESKSA